MTDPLAAIQRRQRQDVNLLYANLADACEIAIERNTIPGRPISETDRLRIMADVDRSLDVIFGRHPGSESAIKTIVLRDTTAVRFAPLDSAVKRWKREMPETLRNLVEQEAMDG